MSSGRDVGEGFKVESGNEEKVGVREGGDGGFSAPGVSHVRLAHSWS